MSVYVSLKLKDSSSPDEVNTLLKESNITYFKRDCVIQFPTKESNQNWLDDINNNPSSSNANLKPKNGLLSMEALKKIFPGYTDSSIFDLDIGFSRTSPEEMDNIVVFIANNKELFQSVDGIDELVSRSNLNHSDFSELIASMSVPYDEPKMLPEKEQLLKPDGYVAKANGINGSEVLLSFGSVETPRYAKEKRYVDDSYNGLMKDDDGRALILMPLIPFGQGGVDTISNTYDWLADSHMEESPISVMLKMYKTSLLDMMNDDHHMLFSSEDEITASREAIQSEHLFRVGIEDKSSVGNEKEVLDNVSSIGSAKNRSDYLRHMKLFDKASIAYNVEMEHDENNFDISP